MNTKAKGTKKERQSRDLFAAEGWNVIRPGASLGAADLICLKAGQRPLAVQVKCNIGSPFDHFRPAERAELVRWARSAGCAPVLAYWAPRARTHLLIGPSGWPS